MQKGTENNMLKKKISLMCAVLLIGIFSWLYAGVTPVTENVTVEIEKPALGELNFDLDTQRYADKSSSHIGWGFKKEKGAAPYIDKKSTDLFLLTDTYYIDNRGKKVLYLTFDEGYENGYTSTILDVLKEKNVPAAFFITGHYQKNESSLVDRMVNEGHIVGNHTVNHPNLAKSDLTTVVSELKGLNDMFLEKYQKNMIYLRPPEGEYSEKLLHLTRDMGYKTILWSFAYRDWEANVQRGGEYAFNQVTPYLHDGAIILLHAVSADNAAALGDIIDYARNQGYEFKSLDSLLT